ncbi:MAG: hypothetical protein Q8L27_03140 [archaeon]|nr:hypothetical protein [archaeon]
MTEKDYSGATTAKIGKNAKSNNTSEKALTLIKSKEKRELKSDSQEGFDI